MSDDKNVKVEKTYKIDEFTTVKKLSNGCELIEEDYSKERNSSPINVPQKIYRLLHPGGRQDTKMVMSRLKTKAKKK